VLDRPVRSRPRRFDPTPHERELVAIVDEIVEARGLDRQQLDGVLKRFPRNGCGLFSRSELIAGFRHFKAQNWREVDDADFVAKLRLRPVRTQSGVTPVTVLTKPFPCPGECIFCPNDVRMPKSYLADEPGAQRAEDNHFDPYLQTWNRLDAYRSIGHPVEKIELIILGGTWSFHPEPYQVWFVKRCFDALNDYGNGVDGCAEAGRAPARFRDLDPIARGTAGAYNQRISARLHETERASWEELFASHRINETARCRSVGLAVETRPDHILDEEVTRTRRLGCTKVQIGLQSLSDRVRERHRRGCGVAASRRALRMLRGAGFKVHAHWMPNLLGSSPQQDADDYARLFDDPDFRPDELKLYPCSLIESAELMNYYESGEWRPYQHEELVELLAKCLERTPAYCRVTRVIRDFSSGDIVAGNKVANLREVAEAALAARGASSRDIRAREIRGAYFDPNALVLAIESYKTSIGMEHFLEFTTPDDRLVGFLRLSLPHTPVACAELRHSAMIREVHVYGDSLGLGRRGEGKAQHLGLGRQLIERAETIAAEAGFRDLAVISAVGTREYYRRLDFVDGDLYQHLALCEESAGTELECIA